MTKNWVGNSLICLNDATPMCTIIIEYWYVSMLAYTKRETKCEFGSPCRNMHMLLFLIAQRMSAKHSLGSWFYSWSTNTLFIGFVYTYSLLTTLLQCEYTGTVRVLVNFLCVCTVHKYSVIFQLSFSLHVMQVERFVVTMQLASLLSSQRRYYQTASLLFVIDFGSLVIVSYHTSFVSYRYVEITITNDN